MDAFQILFLKCSEYPVVVEGEEVPLWMVSREDIEKGKVDFRLEWENLADLVLWLYEFKRKQMKTNGLLGFPMEKVLIGLAYLEPGECITDPNIAGIEYLVDIVSTRIRILQKRYFQGKKPLNTTVFEDMILMFPQRKNIKNIGVLSEEMIKIVEKLRNLDIPSPHSSSSSSSIL